ncbi:YdbH domain-containing protein [Qipengyuania sp. 1NDW9]|uniref:intermembrane phospholipid transport protein YdbH family protein n=1 Tax=Qipengyuania xiapuensis TaxID=2867236 RepID=UPI001C868C72|nr:YdbH domain-containing protein [Qipengyuania xiapuensis]MBX7493352.1 YdbH domain-containing protein [Qipengyuania xiapuensis]
MDGSDDQIAQPHRPRWRKKRWAIPGLSILVLLAVGLTAWASRESIVNDLIREELAGYDIPASYDLLRVGGRTQIISNLVIGDPEAPDFTAERVVVSLRYRLGLPQISSVTLQRPRLYGTLVDGELSFGSLDPLIFGESDAAPGLPDFYLKLVDGRGLVESDYGPIGLKVEGEGLVSDGFAGILAASAPQLAFGECRAEGATLFGKIETDGGEPSFSGPLRASEIACPESETSLSGLVAEVDAATDAALANPSFTARIESDGARYGSVAAQSLAGTVRAQLRDGDATARYSFALRGAESPQALAAVITAEGVLRARNSFARLEIESDVEGNGLRLGSASIGTIESLAASGEGTLVEPIARRIGSALQAETRGSSLGARITYRSDDGGSLLLLPEAELVGGSGARLLSLSRFEFSTPTDEPARLSGNIATGGPGIPRISGRMERSGGDEAVFRLSMAPYEAGGSRIAIPGITIAQADSGALGFAGEVEASGPLPGGAVDGLSMPVKGRWEPGGELALWRECVRVGFRRLALASLNLAGPGLTICPSGGSPILRYGEAGLRFAAETGPLNLQGSLGDTPLALETGTLAMSYPGQLVANDVDITLGTAGDASRFAFARIDADFGETITGAFEGGEASLAAVPMDLTEVAGGFSFADGRLAVGDGAFRLTDREEPDRFEPLVARDASLTLVDNVIDAEAALRNPASDRIVTLADIRHNLETGSGYANLDIEGLRFDEGLQPEDVSQLALGVIANAEGVITGSGRIDWSSDGEVTSSGAFSSENIDFAAAFGPVKGASGTIEFTDLLNLTTAPNQTLKVASVNPGIEVLDGEVSFELRNGELLSVAGGSWPFMGGRLILREVDLNLGVSEERRYIFEIVGLDAGQFVAQMELENISATGTFDGTVPIVFDAEGNGFIEEGILLSRPPGGNISYVGELTYEDLSAIANFAFDALRSLDYSQMRIIMDGPLTGEIVTRVRFDGVRQGEDAKTNFITRQIADLPIQFRINIRAQFYQLLTSLKAMYDPASVRDPRELGLLDDDGTRLRRSITGEEVEPDIDPEDVIPDEPTIQDQESE